MHDDDDDNKNNDEDKDDDVAIFFFETNELKRTLIYGTEQMKQYNMLHVEIRASLLLAYKANIKFTKFQKGKKLLHKY